MKIYLNYLGLFFLIFIFDSCFNKIKEDQILGSWKIANVVEVKSQSPEMSQTLEKMARQIFISDGYILNFFPDSIYSEVTGYKVESGKWSIENGKMIKFGGNEMIIEETKVKRKIRYLIAKVVYPESNMELVLKFVKVGRKLKDYKLDPYYPDNNIWRIKPDHPETDAEIAMRLKNYVYHLALLFKAGADRENNTVSWNHSNGIVRIFGNGIGSIDFEKVDEDWKNCFYDEADALKAYNFYKAAINRTRFHGGTSDNRFISDYNILLLILDNIYY